MQTLKSQANHRKIHKKNARARNVKYFCLNCPLLACYLLLWGFFCYLDAFPRAIFSNSVIAAIYLVVFINY